ncbi:flagellin and related hook-associated proteins [Pelotomaculum thermopropionicum SI]|uniref:Flagellin and related hook-associated proteins n=1 Tax=Pelotomaculum thermopropionicum (strain DSM 13744 / JCM 10971 / SI) TaxID=370438 RepID=A5D0E1_PELTS|nr:flagellin and related hook-associated proteins [Pelotomaculum thermopropionicum SI]
MRVTNKMIAQTVLNNLAANLNRLQKLQDQMSSLHVVSKTSDDPMIATRVVTLNSVLKQHDQYEQNISDAKNWIETTESTLGNVTDALQRAREQAVYGANGTLDQTSREAIAQEIDNIFDNIVQLANTNFAGRYIFGGTKTTTKPFESDGEYKGNEGKEGELKWEISQKVEMIVNIDGKKVFGDTSAAGDNGIFTVLNNLRAHLRSGDTQAVSNTDLGELDRVINGILNLRASLGAKANRLETATSQSGGERTNYEALLSKLNDVDLAKVVTDFSMQENVYQAALSTGARIILPSLVNFLT